MRQAPPFYQFVYASQMPTPGAMAYGFESEMLAWRAACGPGIGARQQFYSISPQPGALQAASLGWLGGLTGVVHGQSILQPLSNPYG
jgi:hypothetical protein